MHGQLLLKKNLTGGLKPSHGFSSRRNNHFKPRKTSNSGIADERILKTSPTNSLP